MDKETKKDESDDSGLLKEILANIQIDIEADDHNRKEMLDDIKFCSLDQWPAELRADRENDPNGPRPCLTIDLTNQYITQIVNDLRQNKPAIKMRPDDDEASIEAAQVHQGMTRNIEDKSSATIAYENAGEWAVRTGRGYFRVLTDYIPGTFDQEAKILPIEDAFSVILGYHIMPDGSDAKRGTITTKMTIDDFKRKYPKAKHEESSFDGEFAKTLHSDEMISVLEHFYIEYEEKTLLFLKSGETLYSDEYDGSADSIADKRQEFVESVKWCKLTGAEILEKREWIGKHIPIIEVIGKQSLIEDKKTFWGVVRPVKDVLRMYNYWNSAITEKIALSPKTPFIMAAGQDTGFEPEWKNANKESRAALHYNPIDINGNAIPPPQRVQPAPIEAAMIQAMSMIENQVRSALGMFKASVGDASSQQSGKALGLLQRESDTGTFHFSDNLAYSIAYCGRILLDINTKLIETKRNVRTMGEDGESSSATIDPNQAESYREFNTPSGVKKSYNLGVGKFNVSVTVGPSYTTKRMEASTVFTELARSTRDPATSSVMNYLAIKNSDVTSSDEATTMLKSLLPPQVQSVEDGEAPIPPKAMQQIQQMQQQGQQMQEALQKLTQENQQLKSGQQSTMAKVEVDRNAKMEAINLDRQVEAEKAKLEREKFEFEKQLEIEKANHEIELSERKAKSEHEIKVRDRDFDEGVRMQDEMGKEGVAILPQMTEAMNNLASLSQVFQNIQNALNAQTEIQQATLAAIERPKSVSLGKIQKDASGRIIGAEVNTTIQ